MSEAENDELMQPFKEQEIIDVIWSMEPDKAPSPDGFSFQFYRIIVITSSLGRIQPITSKQGNNSGLIATFIKAEFSMLA